MIECQVSLLLLLVAISAVAHFERSRPGGPIVNIYDLPFPELHRATQNTREHHEDQLSLVSCPILSRQCLKKVELISRVTEIYPRILLTYGRHSRLFDGN